MAGDSSAAVSDDEIRRMVHHLRPSWTVEEVERSDQGTDFVAMLEVWTPGHERGNGDGDGRVRRVVLKAMTADWVTPETVRAEPRAVSLADERTTIPVPTVFDYCDDHENLPAPFFLTSYVEGVQYDPGAHPPAHRTRMVREAGHHLAQLHDLDVLNGDRVGRVGVVDGELTVLDTGEFSGGEQFHEWLLGAYEESLDSLAEGGYFPDLAEEPPRFGDIVPDLRQCLRETIPRLPDPEPAVLCHGDYRAGNLLIDPGTGETRAVLDWGSLSMGAPAYNLANTESLMLSPDDDDPDRTAALRETFRSAYASAREDWEFDDRTRERMSVYRLTCRIDAMACLPLWYEDTSPAERDARAAEHREFVEQYL